MRALLSYIARGRTQAITSSALCAALSLILPPLSYISGAIIGLATLRQGASEGGLVIAGSVLLAGAFTFLAIGTAYPVLAFTLITWAPIWLLASLLRHTVSLSTALTGAALLGALGVVVAHIVLDAPADWWHSVLDEIFRHAIEGSHVSLAEQVLENLGAMVDYLAPIMTGLVAAGSVFGLIVTLFLARWWHAMLDNPGGFAREFHGLRFDRSVAIAAVFVTVLALFANDMTGGLAREILWLFVVLYLFQGLALVHGLVAKRGAATGWLVALYALLLVFSPQVIVLLALAGISDTWLDLRERLGNT